MKKIIFIFIIFISTFALNYGQEINWNNFNVEQNDLLNFQFGYDFGMIAKLGFGHQVQAFKPLMLQLDCSLPMGKQFADDFKSRLGGQLALWEKNHFILTSKLFGSFKRYQTEMVRMASIGAEIAGVIGYYKPKWHIAVEVGFEKSIVTHLKHFDALREINPSITDGWYLATSGYWHYGLQAGKNIGRQYDISLKLGVTDAEASNENALLPYYFLVGLMRKF